VAAAVDETVDWRQFGRHRQYGNGTPRTLARGWVHVFALLALEATLWACSASLGGPFQPLPARAVALARWSAVAFYGSVVFHLVPWDTEPAYNVALCADFMAIMCVLCVS
jgi:predicted membrane channel-forming protein YqfA (hemolysin III family)